MISKKFAGKNIYCVKLLKKDITPKYLNKDVVLSEFHENTLKEGMFIISKI